MHCQKVFFCLMATPSTFDFRLRNHLVFDCPAIDRRKRTERWRGWWRGWWQQITQITICRHFVVRILSLVITAAICRHDDDSRLKIIDRNLIEEDRRKKWIRYEFRQMSNDQSLITALPSDDAGWFFQVLRTGSAMFFVRNIQTTKYMSNEKVDSVCVCCCDLSDLLSSSPSSSPSSFRSSSPMIDWTIKRKMIPQSKVKGAWGCYQTKEEFLAMHLR